MDDAQIIELYWRRSEEAVAQTARKYGRYCHAIALRILENTADSEECVSDTYWKTWSRLPPERPEIFSAFLGKITRNLALDRYRGNAAQKRGGGRVAVALDELNADLSTAEDAQTAVERQELVDALNQFLTELEPEKRRIFLRRYWYFCSVKEIAAGMKLSESKVKMTLLRTRAALKDFLTKEGILP